MDYIFSNDIPIYLQIVDLIINEIGSGKLQPGQKLPSVREYATLFKVNPNTICKALTILEEKNLIYTERTNGKYVSNNERVIKDHKEVVFEEKVTSFMNDLYMLGYTKDEIIEKIKGMMIWA